MADSVDPIVWILTARADNGYLATTIAASGTESAHRVAVDQWPAWVADQEANGSPRWVFSDSSRDYAPLVEAGVRVAKSHDLRLCHAILRDTAMVDASDVKAATQWDVAPYADDTEAEATLFDLDGRRDAAPSDASEVRAEFDRQRSVLDRADGRLRLLTVAESTGGLIAVELRSAGLPWHTTVHEEMLVEALGAKPAAGVVPAKMQALAVQVRDLLGDPAASLDSQQKLLRSLHRAGILVESTSKWELENQTHPAVAPLLEYKKLSRLYSANGWAWLSEWVSENRFRPVYVPGGVVTGRWASSGGGALQIPRSLRRAVRADEGFALIVADVAQLEPRVLAAMSRDAAMARAAKGKDLYSGLVDAGIVASRQEAKIAVLGAMYGATTGESGRLVPRLRRAFPAAMALVDTAAKTGEDGGIVSTLLGRSTPAASDRWIAAQRAATDADAGEGDEQRARRSARDRGRFTRNFVVQGTAAEWALAWLAEIRRGLMTLSPAAIPAPQSGPSFARSAHLAFFLHDEVILHVPAEQAEAAADIVREAARRAGTLLFGDFDLDFPLDLRIAQDASKD